MISAFPCINDLRLGGVCPFISTQMPEVHSFLLAWYKSARFDALLILDGWLAGAPPASWLIWEQVTWTRQQGRASIHRQWLDALPSLSQPQIPLECGERVMWDVNPPFGGSKPWFFPPIGGCSSWLIQRWWMCPRERPWLHLKSMPEFVLPADDSPDNIKPTSEFTSNPQSLNRRVLNTNYIQMR